tara:strand:+ start:411 stop:872 length:462 start_codon:yes stop_codon:yes gene_type:complete
MSKPDNTKHKKDRWTKSNIAKIWHLINSVTDKIEELESKYDVSLNKLRYSVINKEIDHCWACEKYAPLKKKELENDDLHPVFSLVLLCSQCMNESDGINNPSLFWAWFEAQEDYAIRLRRERRLNQSARDSQRKRNIQDDIDELAWLESFKLK